MWSKKEGTPFKSGGGKKGEIFGGVCPVGGKGATFAFQGREEKKKN